MYCEYYSEKDLKIEKRGFSLIHFNSRSLYSNFSKIKDLLNRYEDKFSVVAVSETWISEGKELLDMYTQNRPNKRGGGVALFVKTGLDCMVLDNMIFSVENLMECLSIEIKCKKSKNIVISCIYRSPGSCIDNFNEKICSLFRCNRNKMTLVCGDFNIDLLKSNEHEKTTEFINIMYSLSFYPLILRPSRITKDSVTLIDNIFINQMDIKTKSGRLITYITDHLPVFVGIEMTDFD